jgi:hypothetical protein
LNSEKRYGKYRRNCEKIWKIWKKIVKGFGKYRGKLRNDLDYTEET